MNMELPKEQAMVLERTGKERDYTAWWLERQKERMAGNVEVGGLSLFV
jgi:hypothetical protein